MRRLQHVSLPYPPDWQDDIRAFEEHGILLFLEHKNSEPAMKIMVGNVGMTLHVIHKLRAQGSTT